MANLFTKESIKARMFKQAATLYDIRNIDGIDPFIRLLIEALKADCWRKSLPPLLHTRHWLPNPPMLLLLPDHIHRKLLYLPQTYFLIKARR